MAKARILIVEDSLIVAYHLRKTLETEKYSVVGIESTGEGALVAIQRYTPDLVMMDIMLAGKMDGVETAMQVRSRYHIPVVFLTALSDTETIQRAKITEPFGYITKPFEDREIFTVIEMALYKHAIEMKLRQSEEKYLSTVRAISDAVVTVDQDFRISYCNPSVLSMLGTSLENVQGNYVFDTILLKDNGTGDYPVNPFQVVSGNGPGNSLPANLCLIAKDGREIPIEGSISPVIDSKGAITGLLIIFKDISQKLIHEKLIRDFEKKHMAALLEGQEQERSRIAKDLHDGLGQMLTALKMNIRLSRIDEKYAQSLYRLIDEATQESIRISENILPAKLKDFDLATCLRSLCNGIDATSTIPVSFESFGQATPIEQHEKVNLYRITQEAVNNAMKHSQAQSISVQLNEEENFIQLTIEDDGKGFSTRSSIDQTVHHGLANMRERAEIMGGTLTIESDENRGTLIIVEIPLKSNRHRHAQTQDSNSR
ncbi:MAG TPA: response regulator [Sphingobacteriaceae bacterium]